MSKRMLLLSMCCLCFTRVFSQKSTLYYLSIGNGYYKNVSDVPSAIISAKSVGSILDHYGKGTVLTSKNNVLLSLDNITQAIKEICLSAISDTNAIIFLYYCGHGQTDMQNDNLFFLPGEIDLNKNLLSKKFLLKKLINIRQIQTGFLSLLVDKYQSNKELLGLTMASQFIYSGLQYENTPLKIADTNVNLLKAKKYLDSIVLKEQIHIPRLIIWADCCTDDFHHNAKVYNNHMHISIDEIKNEKNDTTKLLGGMMYYFDSVMKDPGYTIDFINNAFRNTFYILGNKVVYSKNKNTSVETVYFFDKIHNESKKVGPMAHKMLTYFENDPLSFRTYDLINKVISPDFDKQINQCYLETESTEIKKVVKSTPAAFDLLNLNGRIYKVKSN